MTPAHEQALRIAQVLERVRFHEETEEALQRGVETVLRRHSDNGFGQEVRLTATDRIDFMVGRVGIECKTQGGVAAVIRQLFRYAQHPDVDALVLLTTRAQLARVPAILNGKPVVVACTLGGIV